MKKLYYIVVIFAALFINATNAKCLNGYREFYLATSSYDLQTIKIKVPISTAKYRYFIVDVIPGGMQSVCLPLYMDEPPRVYFDIENITPGDLETGPIYYTVDHLSDNKAPQGRIFISTDEEYAPPFI